MLQKKLICLLLLLSVSTSFETFLKENEKILDLSFTPSRTEKVIYNLLKEVQYLRSSHEDISARQDILEDRIEKLEELAKVGTLRTCAEYAQYGLKASGLYMVDPDGPLLGHPPFQVFCNFDEGKEETDFVKYLVDIMSADIFFNRDYRGNAQH